jgi:hypothetical protein
MALPPTLQQGENRALNEGFGRHWFQIRNNNGEVQNLSVHSMEIFPIRYKTVRTEVRQNTRVLAGPLYAQFPFSGSQIMRMARMTAAQLTGPNSGTDDS